MSGTGEAQSVFLVGVKGKGFGIKCLGNMVPALG